MANLPKPTSKYRKRRSRRVSDAVEAEVVPTVSTPTGLPSSSDLPPELSNFEPKGIAHTRSRTVQQWRESLREKEIEDIQQRIKARPRIAIGIGLLLLVQNAGIWFITVWALNKYELGQLQLIYSTLIGGTLIQSYFLLRLIVKQVYGDIDYHNKG